MKAYCSEKPRLPVKFLRVGDWVVLNLAAGVGRPRRQYGVVVAVFPDARPEPKAWVRVGARRQVTVVRGQFDAYMGSLSQAQRDALADALEAIGEAAARLQVRMEG